LRLGLRPAPLWNPDPAGGAYSAPQTPSWFAAGRGRGREVSGKEGKGRGEGEVDSDAQLEQGRRLAKTGPDYSNHRPLTLTLTLRGIRRNGISRNGRTPFNLTT